MVILNKLQNGNDPLFRVQLVNLKLLKLLPNVILLKQILHYSYLFIQKEDVEETEVKGSETNLKVEQLNEG
jgi:hypothetical protein